MQRGRGRTKLPERRQMSPSLSMLPERAFWNLKGSTLARKLAKNVAS